MGWNILNKLFSQQIHED